MKNKDKKKENWNLMGVGQQPGAKNKRMPARVTVVVETMGKGLGAGAPNGVANTYYEITH